METIRTDASNWHPWLQFVLHALTQQTRRLEKKVERENLILSRLPELSVQILDYAREHGRVRIGDTTTVTGANRNTLKEHFRSLVQRGHLTLHGRGGSVIHPEQHRLTASTLRHSDKNKG